MAQDDTEIEIKIKITKQEFSNIKNKLDKTAKFINTTEQADTYYNPSHRNFLEPEVPFEWLSIRKRDEKSIINYKHFYPENADKFTHCDEIETELIDKEKLEKIFTALDIKKLVTVDKQRHKYVYNDAFEIVLDIVKDLGYFIEIEALKNQETIEKTRKKILEFAKTLDLDITKLDHRGYPNLLMKKRGLF